MRKILAGVMLTTVLAATSLMARPAFADNPWTLVLISGAPVVCFTSSGDTGYLAHNANSDNDHCFKSGTGPLG